MVATTKILAKMWKELDADEQDEWREKALSILGLLNGEYRDTIPPALPEEEVRSSKTGEWKFPCGHCEYLTKCRGE